MDQGNDREPLRELVGKAQRGDRQALGELFNQYRPRLLALVKVRLGEKLRRNHEAEDVLQDAFLGTLKSLQQFEWQGDCSFFHWLAGIVENLLRNRARRSGVEDRWEGPGVSIFDLPDAFDGRPRGLLDRLPEREPPPFKSLRHHERFERLKRSIDSLPGDYREVIILARIRQLPMKEIAEMMGRSADGASMLLLRALRQLRTLFGTTDTLHLSTRTLGWSEVTVAPEPPPTRMGHDGKGAKVKVPDYGGERPSGRFVDVHFRAAGSSSSWMPLTST